jgi:phosphohistidine phosphatase
LNTLYLLRHAKSSWDDAGLADRDRPLNPRGLRAAKRLAEHVVQEGIAPDLILCSPARRTRETLERVFPDPGAIGAIEFEDELYGATAAGLLARLRALAEDSGSAMLIGHNPAIGELAGELPAQGERLEELRAKYPTCSLATLTFAGRWADLQTGAAELNAFVKPREL